MTAKHRVHLVTGAGSGIGAAIYRRLIAGGDSVIGVDVTPPTEPGEAEWRILDVTDATGIAALAEQLAASGTVLDSVVMCAGTLGTVTGTDIDPTEWDRVMAVNVTAPMLLVSRLGPLLRSNSGRIVAIASVNARRPGPYLIPYRVSKAALVMLIQCLSSVYAPRGITVNAVSPGVTLTPMQRGVAAAKVGDDSADAYLAERAKRLPLGRLVAPDDIADAVEYLLSPAAAMVTGENLVVDGGESRAL